MAPRLLGFEEGMTTLRWSCDGEKPIGLFRISRSHSGDRQISFTDQAELRLFQPEPGDYEFRVQACQALPGGYPLCGDSSPPLNFTLERDQSDSRVTASGKTPEAADVLNLNPVPNE